MSSEAFIVTNKDRVVPFSTLTGFAFKNGDVRGKASDSFTSIYDVSGLIQPLYNFEVLARLVEINTWHRACVDRKAHDTVGIGWNLVSINENQGDENNKNILKSFFTEGVKSSGLEKMLTSFMIDYETLAFATLELVRENYDPSGVPTILNHLPSYTIRAERAGNKFAQKIGNITTWFKRFGYDKDVDFKTGKEYDPGLLDPDQRATEILCMINYNVRSPFYGLPDILPAMGAIEGGLSLREYNIAFFRNYGVPSYAIYITGDYSLGEFLDKNGNGITDPDFDRESAEYDIVRAVKEHLEDIKTNPHSPMVLAIPTAKGVDGGKVDVEFKPLSVDVKEASFRLYRTDCRDEILTAHGVPPYRVAVNETGSLGGSTAEQANEIYKESIIQPRKREVENIMNRVIQQGFQITDWIFELEELGFEDDDQDVKIIDLLFSRGGITPNEIIKRYKERFNLSESGDPAMDWHYINGQPVEAGAVLQDGVIKQVMELADQVRAIAKKGER